MKLYIHLSDIHLNSLTYLNDPHACALTFEYVAQIACKMGHFVNAERFNVRCTQWVGSGHFFSTKFQYIILAPNRAALNTQKWKWGHLKKSRFFHRTPYFWIVQQSIYLSDCCHHPETRTGDELLNQLEQLQKKHGN